MRLPLRLLLVLLALLAAVGLLLTLTLAGESTLPAAPQTTPADAHALKSLLERHDPRRLLVSRPPSLAVGESELNLVINLLAQQRAGLAATADLQDGRLRLRMSQQIGPFWLNARADLLQTPGWPALDEVRLGRLPLPASLARSLLIALLERQQALDPLRALRHLGEQIRFEPGKLTVVLHWQPDSVERLLDGLWPVAERERALAYHQALVTLASAHRVGTPVSLAEVLPPLFSLAARRSAAGADPAAENRMALLTLALHASGRGWASLLPVARNWPRAPPLALRLNGRDDFALHWLYSAALAVVGGGPLADLIGLDKELADADGGSGFSFNDIACDRAGARLGVLALAQPGRVQGELARAHADSLLLPDVSDLPEFLTQSEFQARYGGTQGAGYRQMMAEIEARLARMPLYR